jgi:hypothetical protein
MRIQDETMKTVGIDRLPLRVDPYVFAVLEYKHELNEHRAQINQLTNKTILYVACN